MSSISTNLSFLVNSTGDVYVASTTPTVSTTTGALIVAGGAGIGNTLYAALVRPTAIQENRVVMAALDIDLTAGNYFTKTITAVSTLTVSNVPSSGTVGEFVLKLTNGGSSAVTWFSGVKWASGTAPILTISGVDNLGFYTEDGGTSWQGFVLSKDSK